MLINYSKMIFLNLIISILIYILSLNMDMDTNKGIAIVVLLGFVSSLFFKENLLGHFLKLTLVNTLIFYFLSVLIIYLELVINYNILGDGDNLAFGYAIFYSFGYIAGIIPQGIFERFKKREKVNL